MDIETVHLENNERFRLGQADIFTESQICFGHVNYYQV